MTWYARLEGNFAMVILVHYRILLLRNMECKKKYVVGSPTEVLYQWSYYITITVLSYNVIWSVKNVYVAERTTEGKFSQWSYHITISVLSCDVIWSVKKSVRRGTPH